MIALYVILFALLAGAVLLLFRYRQQIKLDAAAEAYRVREAARREEEKTAQYAKGLYQQAKSKLP